MALDLERIKAQPVRTIKLLHWLNVPRFPPFDRWGVPRGPVMITREAYYNKMNQVYDFSMPATHWFLAKRFVGKSTGAEDVGIDYIECVREDSVGGTVVDFYSSDDDEGANWVKSGYYPILLVCGNKVNVEFEAGSLAAKLFKEGKLKWCHIGDLGNPQAMTREQLEAAIRNLESYKVVVTVPGLYYNANEMFRALSAMIDLLKQRGKTRWKVQGKRKIICLLVREAKILLASRYWAGAVASRQDAEYDLIDLNDGAYHRGIAIAFDALRFTSITPDVRDLAEYVYIKRMGRTKIPAEFKYVLRYVKPRQLRRMGKGEFILYTDTDDIYAGVNAPVPWHVERGEAPLWNLGIKTVENVDSRRPATPEGEAKQTVLEEAEGSQVRNMKWKVGLEVHKWIVELVESEGLSFAKAQKKMEEGVRDGAGNWVHKPIHLSVATLHNEVVDHREKTCIELIDSDLLRKQAEAEDKEAKGDLARLESNSQGSQTEGGR